MPAEEHNPSALLELAMAGNLDMDTGAERQGPAQSDATTVDTTTETTNANDAGQVGATAQDDEQPAPIVSKSGAYTIPYDKLLTARQERDQYKLEGEQHRQRAQELEMQLNQQQQANLQQAQQEAQSRADAGQEGTQADTNLATAQAALNQGVDMALFGDFSEEDIAKGIEKMVAARVDARIEAAMAPVLNERNQQHVQTAKDAHFGSILGKHPDAFEVIESAEWDTWLKGQPAFMRSAIDATMDKGSAEQVVEVFDSFKKANGANSGGAQKALQAAIRNAGNGMPSTLSDMPGGLAAQGGAEQLQGVTGDPTALLDLMAGKSSEEIDRLMNSVL